MTGQFGLPGCSKQLTGLAPLEQACRWGSPRLILAFPSPIPKAPGVLPKQGTATNQGSLHDWSWEASGSDSRQRMEPNWAPASISWLSRGFCFSGRHLRNIPGVRLPQRRIPDPTLLRQTESILKPEAKEHLDLEEHMADLDRRKRLCFRRTGEDEANPQHATGNPPQGIASPNQLGLTDLHPRQPRTAEVGNSQQKSIVPAENCEDLYFQGSIQLFSIWPCENIRLHILV